MLSKIWAHVGTLAALLGAGLTDFHAVAVAGDVRNVLTAVAGLLVAVHIPFAAKAKVDLTDAFDAVERLMVPPTHATTTPAVRNITAQSVPATTATSTPPA